MNDSTRICNVSDPKMQLVGTFELAQVNQSGNREIKYQYKPLPNAPMYWPGYADLKDVKDIPNDLGKNRNKSGMGFLNNFFCAKTPELAGKMYVLASKTVFICLTQ